MPNQATAWPRVKLGDVVRQVKDKVDPQTSGLHRFVAGEHMDTDELRITRWGEINGDYLGPAFHMRFRPGHVLYGSRRTYLRKVAVADFEGITANTTFVIESRNTERCLPDFVPYVLSAPSFHAHSKKQSKGSVNPYVNFSDLAWYEFELPPLEEQVRLVSLLDASRLVCESMKDAQLAHARMVEAFCVLTASRRDGQFTRVGEIAKFSSGKSIKVSGLDSVPSDAASVPVYGGNGVSGYTSESMPGLPQDTVVLGRVGQYCGAVHLVRGAGWITDNALYPKTLNEKVLPTYLAICLRGLRLNRNKLGEYLPLITQKVVHAAEIPLLSLDEQARLENAYVEMEAAGQALSERTAEAHELHVYLLEELLGGTNGIQ